VLRELGFDGGRPISEDFFRRRISGRHNPEIFADLFPALSAARHDELAEDKEARFRALASTSLRPLPGLLEYTAMLTRRGVRVAAVTNAPRANVRATLTPVARTPPSRALTRAAHRRS
jgi:phosphoglycolate phosphatase-like HAD superfamily hydrolase